MNDEQKAWQKQFQSNFGAREFLRFEAAFCLWILLGAFVGAWIRWLYLGLLSLGTAVALPIISRTWKPGYKALRIILGNRNLPVEPMPRGPRPAPPPMPWWAYISGIWFLILTLILFYLFIRIQSR